MFIGGGAFLLVGGHTPGSDHLGHQGREGRGQCREGLVTTYSAQTSTDQEQETGDVILNNLAVNTNK